MLKLFFFCDYYPLIIFAFIYNDFHLIELEATQLFSTLYFKNYHPFVTAEHFRTKSSN